MIEWKDEFSVGVPVLDEDHKVLISLVNRFLEAFETTPSFMITNLFRDLERYTVFHFDREEEFMAKCGYEGLEEHKRQHAALCETLQGFSEKMIRLMSDEEKNEFKNFLHTWLYEHILGEDFKYRESMQKLDLS